jgi:hypothetical protein
MKPKRRSTTNNNKEIGTILDEDGGGVASALHSLCLLESNFLAKVCAHKA